MGKTIIYQMLPRLWGRGKFTSVDDSSLEYLRELGATHVWYTGVIRHSTGKPFVKGDTGSPYAISDYWDVNPYLSDNPGDRMEEFEALVARTHSHGLKVILDFVPNHVGKDYGDSHGGIPHFDRYDYDWSDTLKIDYSHPDTWETMCRIVRFWASKGVDAFRCDMVELVPVDFFKYLISSIKADYPSIIFIAEVYQKERYREFISHAGFDFLYDKSGLYDALRALTAGQGSARAITWNWQFLGDMQPRMLNFLENHDEQRLASPWFAGTKRNYACLYASLMFNTAPFMLYFGQEIGVDASEGHEGRTSIFDRKPVPDLERLYEYIHGKEESLSPSEVSVLVRYRQAMKFASSGNVSSGQTFDLCYCQNEAEGFNPDKHFVFLRKSNNKTEELKDVTFLFFCNFSHSEAKLRVRIPDHAIDYLSLGTNPAPDGITLTVAPLDAVVITLEKRKYI